MVRIAPVGLFAALSLAPFAAEAAPFLSVDFNGRASFGSGAAGPTETGFEGFTIPANSPAVSSASLGFVTDAAVSSGTVTVTLQDADGDGSAELQGRDRGTPADAGALTYGQLYRDFAFSNPGNVRMDLLLEGLLPNTAYDVRLFSFDDSVSATETLSTVEWSVVTGSGTAGTISFQRNGVDPTSDEQYSTLIRATTNGAGVLEFAGNRIAGSGNVVVLNGFTIAAVPEPASLALLAAGGVCLLGRRRG